MKRPTLVQCLKDEKKTRVPRPQTRSNKIAHYADWSHSIDDVRSPIALVLTVSYFRFGKTTFKQKCHSCFREQNASKGKGAKEKASRMAESRADNLATHAQRSCDE